MVESWLKCSAPECPEFGCFVYRRRNAQGQEVSARACGAHRARGEAWLAKGQPLVARGEIAAPPAQTTLL